MDYRLLWGELTEEVISDGFQFYATFYRSPPAIKALLHGMVGVGVLALVAKLFRWDDSAMFFDGTSIGMKNPARFILCHCFSYLIFSFSLLFLFPGAYVLAIAVYATVTIPTLKTVVEPLEVDSHEDRILALRVLSASNVITIMLLGVLLTLQVRLPLTLARVRVFNEWNVGWTGICEESRCCCFGPVRG